jgi:hypothetical protein
MKGKEFVPVSGIVKLDGEPKENVTIYLHGTDSPEQIWETGTSIGGKYCWAMYTPCDGVVPGEYKVTFKYLPNKKRDGDGPDELKGKYSDPATSAFSLKVEKGKPQKDIDYELTSP